LEFATTLGLKVINSPNAVSVGKRVLLANAFGVAEYKSPHPRVVAKSSNPGLKLANAFGVP
jgi:hypothetical protein